MDDQPYGSHLIACARCRVFRPRDSFSREQQKRSLAAEHVFCLHHSVAPAPPMQLEGNGSGRRLEAMLKVRRAPRWGSRTSPLGESHLRATYASPPTWPARPHLSCRHPHLPGSRVVTRRRLPSSPRSVRVCPRRTRTYKPPDFPHTRARARKLHPHSHTPTTFSGHLVRALRSLPPSLCLSVSLSLCLSVSLSLCLSVSLSRCLSVSLSLCVSHTRAAVQQVWPSEFHFWE